MASNPDKQKKKSKTVPCSCSGYARSDSINGPNWIDYAVNNIDNWTLDDTVLRKELLKFDTKEIAKICRKENLVFGTKTDMVNRLVANKNKILLNKKKKLSIKVDKKKKTSIKVDKKKKTSIKVDKKKKLVPKLLGEYEFGREYSWVKTHIAPIDELLKWYGLKHQLEEAMKKNDNTNLLKLLEKTVGLTTGENQLSELAQDVKTTYGFQLPLWSVDTIVRYTGNTQWCEELRGSLRSTGDTYKTPENFFALQFLKKTFEDYTQQINKQIANGKINQSLKKKITGKVFHGIGGVNRDFCIDLFVQFDETKPIKWAGPISTTTKPHIATIFADKGSASTGIILELARSEGNWGMPVRELSTKSSHEEEVLFFNPTFELVDIYYGDLSKFHPAFPNSGKQWILRPKCVAMNVWPVLAAHILDVDVLEAIQRVKSIPRFSQALDDKLIAAIRDCLVGRFYAKHDQTCWKEMAPKSYEWFQKYEKQKVYVNYIYDDVVILMLLGAVLLIFVYCISCLFGIMCGYFGEKIIKKQAKSSSTKNHRESI